MISYEIIKQIRRVVNANQKSIMHQAVTSQLELSELKELFGIDKCGRSGFADVPISSCVDLGRDDALPYANASWHDILTKHIRGKNWSKECVDYFTDEIGYKPYPAPGAEGYLELTIFHNLASCEKGNHRLPPMICYLAAIQGELAVMRKVRVYFYKFDEFLIDQLKIFYGESLAGVKVSAKATTRLKQELNINNVIRIDKDYYTLRDGDILWFCNELKPSPIQIAKNLIGLGVNHQERLQALKQSSFVEIPHAVIQRLFSKNNFDQINKSFSPIDK